MQHILYYFRRCPYVMRARMALTVAGIKHDLIAISLKNKPAELLRISPKATVPVLVLQGGQVIDESLAIMQWALQQQDPNGWLDYNEIVLQNIYKLITINDTEFKYNLDRYKYQNNIDALTNSREFLNNLNTRLNLNQYLCADTISIADIAIFPFVRQFHRVDEKIINNFGHRKLIIWLDNLTNSQLFKQIIKSNNTIH